MVKYSLNQLYHPSKILRILYINDKYIYVFSHSTRNIYTENLREATAFDTYVLRGDPAYEIYEPTYVFFCCCVIH